MRSILYIIQAEYHCVGGLIIMLRLCVLYLRSFAENIQLAIWVVIERNCILYCRRWVDNKLRRKGRPVLSWVSMALLLLLLVVVVN